LLVRYKVVDIWNAHKFVSDFVRLNVIILMLILTEDVLHY